MPKLAVLDTDSSPLSSVPPSVPPQMDGPHLLDATLFWGAAGGVRRVLGAKHQGLNRLGWRHTVMAPGAKGRGQIDCGGVTLPFSGGYRLLLRKGHAARLIERARPDIVEAADPYTLAWAVLRATARLGVPAVAFCHSNLPAVAERMFGEGMGARARDYLVRLYSHFDMVLAPSRGLTAALQSWGVHHAAHQPLGVDCDVFNPDAAEPAWRHGLVKRLGLDPRTQLVVYSGRFAPEKDLQLLADAVGRLGPGHALLAVGSGPCPPQGRHVRLLPTETDSRRLARLLASCDAYAHAGEQETFGLGALEAMACGTPVVTAATGGLGELVEGVGTRVDSDGPAEWAEALQACLGNQGGEPRRQAELALQRALQHDWRVILPQLSRRYLRLTGRLTHAPHAPAPVAGPIAGLTGSVAR